MRASWSPWMWFVLGVVYLHAALYGPGGILSIVALEVMFYCGRDRK